MILAFWAKFGVVRKWLRYGVNAAAGIATRCNLAAAGANVDWPSNFPTIDKVVNRVEGGVATSIKSLDLTAESYQKGNKVLNTLKGYVDKLDNFTSRSWGGVDIIQGENYTSKALELAVETGTGSQKQWDQINQAIDYALEKEIDVIIRFID